MGNLIDSVTGDLKHGQWIGSTTVENGEVTLNTLNIEKRAWTFSPYIAAFFAFTETPSAVPATAVRIFVFDFSHWHVQPSPNLIRDPMPNVQFLLLPAHNNPRSVPQQSIASFSNIDDIETWVRDRERSTGQNYLTVIDIPMSERREAIDELRLMGITAGSLFPGLDGLCRSMKEKYFACE